MDKAEVLTQEEVSLLLAKMHGYIIMHPSTDVKGCYPPSLRDIVDYWESDEDKWPMVRLHVKCPTCHVELIRLSWSTPKSTWEALSGEFGFVTLCPRCMTYKYKTFLIN